VKAALVLLLAGVFATGTSQNWTLERARHVLANNVYEVTDTSQSDRPDYQLTF
jgi:CHASE1-domain containing sensor protein